MARPVVVQCHPRFYDQVGLGAVPPEVVCPEWRLCSAIGGCMVRLVVEWWHRRFCGQAGGSSVPLEVVRSGQCWCCATGGGADN